MTRVSVVILNYNGEELLKQFLPSVIQYSQPAEIVVADNGSTDNSLETLRSHFEKVRVIALDKNYGFCGGYNRALQQVDADYYVLLNSDVEVTPGWLDGLTLMLDGSPDIAAAQPKVLSFRQRKKFEYAGAAGGFIDALGYPFCRGRIFDHVEEDNGQYDDQRDIFWATGACFIIRADIFHRFGGFDEDLFAHMEEIDLCWKINRASLRVCYNGKSVVYHLGAATLDYNNPRKVYLNFRNGLVLIFKHLNPIELPFKMMARLMLDWLAAVVFVLKGKWRNGSAIINAHFDFFKTLGRNLKKRQEIRKAYPSYSGKNIYPGLIVADYYLRGRKKLGSVIPDRATFS